MEDFRYGQFHKDRMVHRPFSQVKALAPFFERTNEGWGTQNTPNVGFMSKLHFGNLATDHRANIRYIVSFHEDS